MKLWKRPISSRHKIRGESVMQSCFCELFDQFPSATVPHCFHSAQLPAQWTHTHSSSLQNSDSTGCLVTVWPSRICGRAAMPCESNATMHIQMLDECEFCNATTSRRQCHIATLQTCLLPEGVCSWDWDFARTLHGFAWDFRFCDFARISSGFCALVYICSKRYCITRANVDYSITANSEYVVTCSWNVGTGLFNLHSPICRFIVWSSDDEWCVCDQWLNSEFWILIVALRLTKSNSSRSKTYLWAVFVVGHCTRHTGVVACHHKRVFLGFLSL